LSDFRGKWSENAPCKNQLIFRSSEFIAIFE